VCSWFRWSCRYLYVRRLSGGLSAGFRRVVAILGGVPEVLRNAHDFTLSVGPCIDQPRLGA